MSMSSEKSILVVDDETLHLNAVAELLTNAGYKVLTAQDGMKALRLLQEHQVGIILSDIAMPGMNGYELLEKVRANEKWVHIPFIFFSARTLDSDIRFGRSMGVDDYLVKPTNAWDLLAAVRGRLKRSQQLIEWAMKQSFAQNAPKENQIQLGTLHIDVARHRAWMGSRQVELSAREFALLVTLAERQDEVVTPGVLVQSTHGYQADRSEASTLIRPLVSSVRRKLGYDKGTSGCIENVRGLGYRLTAP